MKQIIFSLTLLLFVFKSFSQTKAPLKDYYLQKSKNQKTGGWVMLGGGVAMTAIGLIMWDKNAKTDPLYLFIPTPGSVFFTAADIGAVLGSIPFFISSSHNSKKAATISFNNRNILLLQQNSFVSKAQPTVTLKISL